MDLLASMEVGRRKFKERREEVNNIMTKNVKDEGKIRVTLLTSGLETDVTREFIMYVAAYLAAEILELTDAPDEEEIADAIDIAIEAFEGGAR